MFKAACPCLKLFRIFLVTEKVSCENCESLRQLEWFWNLRLILFDEINRGSKTRQAGRNIYVVYDHWRANEKAD